MTCDKCGFYAMDDHMREYEDRDVCVSCLVDLKLENGDYQSSSPNS